MIWRRVLVVIGGVAMFMSEDKNNTPPQSIPIIPCDENNCEEECV